MDKEKSVYNQIWLSFSQHGYSLNVTMKQSISFIQSQSCMEKFNVFVLSHVFVQFKNLSSAKTVDYHIKSVNARHLASVVSYTG